MSHKPVGLIMSAAYATSELQAEFGLLPPAFLPVGGKRLYWWQVEELKSRCSKLVLTLPESFSPTPRDAALLAQLEVEIQPIPDGLTLGHSLLYALNILSLGQHSLTVMHGDTLIRGLPDLPPNGLTLHETNTAYTWAVLGKPDAGGGLFHDIAVQSSETGKHKVVSGVFTFADTNRLIRALTKENGAFLDALSRYHSSLPLEPVSSGNWLDFGHMQTYQNSKKAITTERAFNALQIEQNRVAKFSENSFKMEAESHWFSTIPAALRLYTPPFLGRVERDGMAGYATGYQPLTPLNDLLVFGELGRPAWDLIMSACDDFLTSAKAAYDPARNPDPAPFADLLLGKTMERLPQFEAQTGISVTKNLEVNGTALPSLTEMAQLSFAKINPDESAHRTIMHGDFCFSNIMYDSRCNKVTALDPRGFIREGAASIFGDIRYDIAKLAHSCVGKYDFIISGYAKAVALAPQRFSFDFEVDQLGQMAQSAFLARAFGGVAPNSAEITAIMVHLFLSMLPLHGENPARQLALMLNATRLFATLSA